MKKLLPGNLIAWIDVDSVLVDFYEMFHAHLDKQYNIKLSPGFIPSDWCYSDVLNGSVSFKEAFESLPSNWPENLTVYPGASRFMQELKNLGCYVIIVTHLPESQKTWRILNLIKNDVYFDEIYFPYGQPKAVVAEMLISRFAPSNAKQVEGLMVDDNLKNVVEMLALPHVTSGFSVDYPFNQNYLPAKIEVNKLLNMSSTTPQELYETVIKHLRSKT